MEEQREAHVMTQNGGCSCVLAPKNDFFLGPFDMKNGLDVKCKNPKKSFCQKKWFFSPYYEKNDFFEIKSFFGKKPFFIFFCIIPLMRNRNRPNHEKIKEMFLDLLFIWFFCQ